MQRQWTIKGPRSVVLFKTWGYRACWIGLLSLHMIMVLYYLRFSLLYHNLHHMNLAFQLRTYSIGIAQSEYSGIATVHAIVAMIHLLYVVLTVTGSLAARRLVFYPCVSLIKVLTRLERCFQPRTHPFNSLDGSLERDPGRFSRLIASTGRYLSFVFGRKGLLGVDGVYFDDLLVVRELCETALQSYQAYRMTQLLPRLCLIRVYVVLLVLNCWSVPALQLVYGKHHRKRRMFNLILDALLDTIASMGISVILVSTYSPQYVDPRFGFPFTNWFNDLWFTAVYQEFQLIFVVSWGDMLSRLVFVCGLLQNMDAIKDLLQPVAVKPLNIEAAVSTNTRGPTRTTIHTSLTTLPFLRENRFQRSAKYVLHTIVPRFLAVWGIVILGVHIYAECQATNSPCKLRLRPWLSSKPACSLVEIDCHSLHQSPTSIDAVWTRFDPALTAHLTIRHCPELQIPRSLQQYEALVSMKIYNSTILDWSEPAAITTQAHATLRALYFVRTVFTNATLPPGLTTTDFPQSLRSIIASATNLETLPSNLHYVWPQRMALTFEHSQFTSVPEVVMSLQPALVSFSQNPITSVPASLFEIPTLANLLLCYTRIQELPRDVANPSQKLYVFMMEGTNVSTLWSWLDATIARSLTYNKQFFNLHDTRFCAERAQIEAGASASFSANDAAPGAAFASVMDVSTPERFAYSKAAVACDFDTIISFFPLALEDAVSAMGSWSV